MKRQQTGEYVVVSTVGETVKAFVPQRLPPNPPLQISGNLREGLDQALLEIGRLDGISSVLPDAGCQCRAHYAGNQHCAKFRFEGIERTD